jgi:hypothetical protein
MAVNIKQIVDAYATRVNQQDFNIAEDINNLQAALKELSYATLAQGGFANTETLSANKTLTNDDRVMQFLNPNTDNRDVILPAVGETNHPFLIVNTNGGSYTLTVKTAGGSEVATVLPGKNAFFVGNAAQWILFGDMGWMYKEIYDQALIEEQLVGITATQTLTNKRITPRVGATTSSATPAINTDNIDFYHLTAQAEDITSFTTNLSGTPTDAQRLLISVTGTGARSITWGASFENGAVALPTTTVATERLDVLFIWNAVTSKWRCMASGSA